MRNSSESLAGAFATGVMDQGLNIVDIGLASTDMCYFASGHFDFPAAIVTASHNPATDSGVKFFDSEGYKSMPEIEDRISSLAWDLADGSRAAPQENSESLETIDGLSLYRSALKNRLQVFESLFNVDFETVDWGSVVPPQGLILDCSGGASTEWLADGLRRRGLEASEVSSRLDPINQNCGAGDFSPTASWSIHELLMEVPSHRLLWTVAQHLEINDGMAFWEPGQIIAAALDGDGDRVVMVDENGAIIDGDQLLYVLASDRKSDSLFQGPVVGTVMSNLGLEHALDRQGIAFKRTSVGDRYVLEALRESGGTIGGETSGHLICLDKTTTGDGMVAALQILAVMRRTGKSLSALTSGMSRYPQTMVNVKTPEPVNPETVPAIQEAVAAVENELEEQGRVVLRASGTEPVIRVMVEGKNKEQIEILAKRLASVVAESAT